MFECVISLIFLMDPFLCRSLLRTYAHDDVSVGSWMIGLAVKHVNEAKLCCSSWPSGLSATRVTSIDLDIGSFLLICLSDFPDF